MFGISNLRYGIELFSVLIVLNCFQCIAYVFECNAVTMTFKTVLKHVSIASLGSQTSK